MKTPNPEPRTPHPVYLGLDTATPFLSLALWNEQTGTLATFAENIGRDHAKRIIIEVDKLFQTAHVLPTQLAGIGVGVGPGSYTGVRVGIATAKALAKGLKVLLVGVNTLSAVAFAALPDDERGIVALDARKGSVYAGMFEKRAGEIVEHGPTQKTLVSTLKSQYPDLPYHQDICPDAGYLARYASQHPASFVEAMYL